VRIAALETQDQTLNSFEWHVYWSQLPANCLIKEIGSKSRLAIFYLMELTKITHPIEVTRICNDCVSVKTPIDK